MWLFKPKVKTAMDDSADAFPPPPKSTVPAKRRGSFEQPQKEKRIRAHKAGSNASVSRVNVSKNSARTLEIMSKLAKARKASKKETNDIDDDTDNDEECNPELAAQRLVRIYAGSGEPSGLTMEGIEQRPGKFEETTARSSKKRTTKIKHRSHRAPKRPPLSQSPPPPENKLSYVDEGEFAQFMADAPKCVPPSLPASKPAQEENARTYNRAADLEESAEDSMPISFTAEQCNPQ